MCAALLTVSRNTVENYALQGNVKSQLWNVEWILNLNGECIAPKKDRASSLKIMLYKSMSNLNRENFLGFRLNGESPKGDRASPLKIML